LGCPPKVFSGKPNIKIGCKIQHIRTYNFVARGSNLTKRFHVTCRGAGVMIWVQLFGWFGRAQTVPNSARFSTTLDFDCEYLRDGRRYWQVENGLINYNPSHVRRKKFCELWSTNVRAYASHVYQRNSTSLKGHISAPSVRCPLKFLQTLENGKACSPTSPLFSHSFPSHLLPSPYRRASGPTHDQHCTCCVG